MSPGCSGAGVGAGTDVKFVLEQGHPLLYGALSDSNNGDVRSSEMSDGNGADGYERQGNTKEYQFTVTMIIIILNLYFFH